jgi:hypothetical protein
MIRKNLLFTQYNGSITAAKPRCRFQAVLQRGALQVRTDIYGLCNAHCFKTGRGYNNVFLHRMGRHY